MNKPTALGTRTSGGSIGGIDFYDLGVIVESVDGRGMPPVIQRRATMPGMDGAIILPENYQSRPLQFSGQMIANSHSDMIENQNALRALLAQSPIIITDPIEPDTFYECIFDGVCIFGDIAPRKVARVCRFAFAVSANPPWRQGATQNRSAANASVTAIRQGEIGDVPAEYQLYITPATWPTAISFERFVGEINPEFYTANFVGPSGTIQPASALPKLRFSISDIGLGQKFTPFNSIYRGVPPNVGNSCSILIWCDANPSTILTLRDENNRGVTLLAQNGRLRFLQTNPGFVYVPTNTPIQTDAPNQIFLSVESRVGPDGGIYVTVGANGTYQAFTPEDLVIFRQGISSTSNLALESGTKFHRVLVFSPELSTEETNVIFAQPNAAFDTSPPKMTFTLPEGKTSGDVVIDTTGRRLRGQFRDGAGIIQDYIPDSPIATLPPHPFRIVSDPASSFDLSWRSMYV